MQLTKVDFHRSIDNIFFTGGHFVLGFVVAYTIDRVAHKIFNVPPKSHASNFIKAFSWAAGITTSLCLMPKGLLKTFTLRKAGEFLVIDVIVFVAIKYFKNSNFTFFLSGGVLFGAIGSRYTFPIAAFAGALMGCNDFFIGSNSSNNQII